MFGSKSVKSRLTAIEELLRQKHDAEIARHRGEEERLRLEYQEQIARHAVYARETMTRRVGICASEMISQMHITDLDGTVELVRRCNGLRVTSKDITLASMPHYVGVSHAQAAWADEPRIEMQTGPVCSLQTRPDNTLQRYSFDILLTPPMRESHIASYAYRMKIVHGAAMSLQEAARAAGARALKHECVSLTVEFPWSRLTLTVKFPPDYRVSTHAAAYIGDGDDAHDSETGRAQAALRTSEGEASLTLDDPLLNFRYVIFWVGPDETELEQLQKRVAAAAAPE